MALISTLLSTKQRVQFIDPTIGTLVELDCSIEEVHKRPSPASKYEVEDGSTISDNIVVGEIELKITGMISDSPINLGRAALATAVGAVVPSVGLAAAAVGYSLFNAVDNLVNDRESNNPTVLNYRKILDIQKRKQKLTVVTSLSRYENMYITDVSVPRTASTGQALLFDVNFTQLILVSPKVVNIKKYNNANLSAPKSNLGTQQSKPIPAQQGRTDVQALARRFF